MVQASNSVPAPVPDDAELHLRGLASLYKISRYAHVLSPESTVDIGTIRSLVIVAELAPARASDVAAELQLDLSTVSRQLSALEKQGYLRKAADPDDRRASRIEITPEGKALVRQLFENRIKAITPALEKWSAADRDKLFKLLIRLAGDLKSQVEARDKS